MKYKVEFFAPNEFRCPCCHRGDTAALLAVALDTLRKCWGDAVIVNSGWRCPAHNKEVGGAEKSRHLIGCAADVRPRDPVLIGAFHALVKQLFGNLEGWEIKYYATFVHIAVPRDEAASLWTGGKITITSK